ncbi:MAG: nickel pincer cofactor biosynthesis protein LarC [Actinomycetota bacterium]|nr:nickel pincer cofactor biosynthesis protein LarC [Actinomycetota bacterium]
MSRSAYLDCVGGVAGDMLLAALLDAGGDRERLEGVPAALGLADVRIEVVTVLRGGLRALRVAIEAEEDGGRRAWTDLRDVVERSTLPPETRNRALEVLGRLARAEGRVHGIAVEDVHFHELGAVDTLVDVCGTLELLAGLGVDRVVSSPLPLARGHVVSAHGALPLPAPATLELLRGVPVRGVDDEGELVTPTGAALTATLADSWGALPPLVLERAGYGAGASDRPGKPNILRILLGAPEAVPATREVSLLATNLDDLSPELVPDAFARCFEAGALDVWSTPAQMKKGRPGIVLSALARPGDESAVAAAILVETSAIGVRVQRLGRYELARDERVVEVDGNPVRVKLAHLDGRVVNVAPEHDDCAAVARATGRSTKEVWASALVAAREP